MIELAATVYVTIAFAYLAGTMLLSRRKKPLRGLGSEPKLFVFVVPALNEATVIVPTVQSLLEACGHRGRVLVVDDGSDDATADAVEALDNPYVLVLRRRFPNARKGKGQALNHAYRFIRQRMSIEGYDPHDVVLCIVDADGRIQPDAIPKVAPYFREAKVGAVQLLVRIRNRSGWLTRLQDFEFLVFSSITQKAREHVGSVGLGGNGQFTRLSALVELGDSPWSDCLTEDLDLGLRLAIAGWSNRFCGETHIDQQGLDHIPRLIRQRTRWLHGHLQCWKHIPALVRSELPTLTVLDLTYYLAAPAMVLVASGIFTASLAFTLIQTVTSPAFWTTPFGMILASLLYLFSFGPALALMLIYRHRSKDISLIRAFGLAHVLFAYNYIWYIAEWKAIARVLTRRGGWAKTSRVAEAQSSLG